MSPRSVAALAGAVLFLLNPARAFASRKCVETSDTVGLQHCRRYGTTWTLEGEPPLLFTFGFRYSEVATGNTTFTEDSTKAKKPDGYTAYRYSGDALGLKSLSAMGIEGGIFVFPWGQLYLGVAGSWVFGEARLATFQTSNGAILSGDTGINVSTFAAMAPIGYRIALGRASLRPEVGFGFENITVSHQVSGGPPGTPDSGTASATKAVIEPRLSADIWFTQHISFGGYAAINVLDANGYGRAFGCALTFHLRSFDGDTSF